MPEPPNILFIVADQLRARSVGCYGDAQARTPVLDRLAARGTRFTAAYSTYPVCTPARASIQTGLMPTSCHVVWNNQTLEPNVPRLAPGLAGAGYRTAYVGKWHLGGYDGEPGRDYHVAIKRSHRHGWDDPFIITHGEDYRPGHTPTIVGDTPELKFDQWQPTYQSDRAIEFLRMQDGARPWILNLHYAIPHTPYLMPKKYLEMFRPEDEMFPPNVEKTAEYATEMARYNGLTAWLDDEIGRVLDALESLPHGRLTLIVFTSDHGWNLGSHNLPAKFSLYEESACVPLLMAGPGVRAGQVVNEPVSLIDLMPTLLDMAGVVVPGSVEGSSLLPLLRGGPWSRRTVYLQVCEHPEHNYARWDPPSRGVRSARYKYLERRGGERLLFDLQADPYEMTNLADRPELAAVVADHRRELENWRTRTRDPWPGSDIEGIYYSVPDNVFGEFQQNPTRAKTPGSRRGFPGGGH